ncbi:methionine--tRNA ligase [bacterium]|jgi:methionyl-tRNA synthetase|nr:methionine--tRNA ligase [bacterium]MBT6831733.1 methionine--tRNA ligase [bacterium]MBT6996556.1 methionine--tRNA ligase [bacterium]MBT7772882.1 methionine--tRNA ligase [bacterium]
MKKFFTTPIFYINDVPHIGHAYCTLAADTIARFWRKKLGRENVFFLTGVDENSQKTVDAAEKLGEPIEKYLQKMATIWRETWEKCGIDFDDFIRTTEPRHVRTVHEILQKIYDAGDIFPGEYSGLYCTGCESFLKKSDLDEHGNCPAHKVPPQKIQEKNYFFRLSKFQKPLLELFEKNPKLLEPEKRRNEILSFIRGGLDDISISRENAEFGIPLPWDESHKIYVWFDALINYRSGCPSEDFWKNSCHFLGKDITRFHCVIWPAMLISAGISTPAEEFAHGFFTVDGEKMSKSLDNVISPLELSQKFGNDALRLGLLSAFEFGNDGDFSFAQFENFYRTKLAGGVGNLFNRVIVLIHKFLAGKKPENLNAENDEIFKNFEKLLETKKIRSAIEIFFETVDGANELLNSTEPWKLAKVDLPAAEKVFAKLLQKLEILASMAEVLLPETFPKMQKMLGDEKKVGAPEILFPPVEK